MAENPTDSPMQSGDEPAACEQGVDISPDKDGGVLKAILKEGTGEDGPCSGDSVYVHYVGTLLDGEQFDSSRDRGDKFNFTLGKGSVIRAWDVGVATMKRGELCRLTCGSEYAYGDAGSPPKIPPKATLVFEVELFDWKGEDLSPESDGGIVRSILEKGEGFDSPNDGSSVEIHIVGKHQDRMFEDRDVTFTMGEGSEAGIVEGIEIALKKSNKGEKSRLKVKSTFAYGTAGDAEKGIPAGADVDYEMTLKSFEKTKESWEMDLDEKIQQSEICKTKGTNFFKGGKLKLALSNYKRVVDLLDEEKDEEKLETIHALLLAAQLNMAMCHLKLGENLEARDACEKALSYKPESDKAYFRMGSADLNMQNYENAIANFKRVLEIDPNNKAAKNQIVIANSKIKQQNEREKKLYAGMFQKFADKDAKNEVEIKPEESGDDTPTNGVSDKESAMEAEPTPATEETATA